MNVPMVARDEKLEGMGIRAAMGRTVAGGGWLTALCVSIHTPSVGCKTPRPLPARPGLILGRPSLRSGCLLNPHLLRLLQRGIDHLLLEGGQQRVGAFVF